MWRDDDFEDEGKQVKAVRKDKKGKVIEDATVEPEVETENADEHRV